MRIVIMQPTYLPWSGYFELMYNCELFVFLDDVQFNRRSWQRRNRIKTANGELMLAIPVRCLNNYTLIKDVLINNEIPWNVKHLSAIKSNYGKATFFDRYFQKFENIYSQKYLRLLDLNLALINFLKKQIGINTPSILSSTLG